MVNGEVVKHMKINLYVRQRMSRGRVGTREYDKRGTQSPSGLSAPMSSAISVCRPTHVRLVPPRCLRHRSFGAPGASAIASPSPAQLRDAVLARGVSAYDRGLCAPLS